MASLIAKLSRSLGSRQAAIEIRWMRKAAKDPHDLDSMVGRRAQGEPLQYILGTQPFGPLNILTRAPTLIPRPETEQWTSNLANRICYWQTDPSRRRQRPLVVLDLCTGSGCIPLLLCHLLNNQGIQLAALGIDISHSACELARENLASFVLSPGSTIDIYQKNIFDDDFWESVQKAFQQPVLQEVFPEGGSMPLDVITANPPYIPKDQWLRLSPEVKSWEDPIALLGDPSPHGDEKATGLPRGDKGLTFYHRIRDIVSVPGIMSRQSILAMEVGDGQAADVVKIFADGFGRTELWRDCWGKERAVFVCTGD